MICLMAMSCLMVQAQDFDAFFSKWKDKAGIEYQEITNIRDSLLRQMKENMPSFGSIPVQFDFDEDSVNWTVCGGNQKLDGNGGEHGRGREFDGRTETLQA